jgi:hypothetical protein
LSTGRSILYVDDIEDEGLYVIFLLLPFAEFCNREEELKNALAASKSKVRDQEISLREVKVGGQDLKRAMKEATDSEYAISQKLSYETGSRRGLEAKFEVVLMPLQSDQITIAGYEVELNELKGAANYAMACIAVPAEGEEQQSIVDHQIGTPNRLLVLLRATSMAAATDALVRVKSNYPDIDMAKVKVGADTTKDLMALELELEDAAMEVMDNIHYEGDGGDQ